MSDLKKKFEVLDYLKRNKSKFHNISARKVREDVRSMFDIDYSDYIIRKMMVAADIRINHNKPRDPVVNKISFDAGNSSPLGRIEFIEKHVDRISKDLLIDNKCRKEQLDRMEKKLDFVCDFIQYAKSGEVPQ